MTKYPLKIKSQQKIPKFLHGELKGKLAYVDEIIDAVDVLPSGDGIKLFLQHNPSTTKKKILVEKIESVVASLVSGAFEPKINVIEDQLHREVTYTKDPIPFLLKNRDVVQEGPGYFSLGPKLSRLIDYLEQRIIDVAGSLGAAPYRFPAMISPAFLERVKYLENFPQSLKMGENSS